MKIEFNVGDVPVVFERGWFWGAAKLLTPTDCIQLQNPLNPATHFSLRLVHAWEQDIAGKRVRVEKTRPLWFAGFRPQRYVVFVDEQQVAGGEGY
jgi:hypothetical protein